MLAKFFVGKVVYGITSPVIKLLESINKQLFIMKNLNELTTKLSQELCKVRSENEQLRDKYEKQSKAFDNYISATRNTIDSMDEFIHSKGLENEYFEFVDSRSKEGNEVKQVHHG